MGTPDICDYLIPHTVFPSLRAGSQMSAWSRMSTGPKVIVFQICTKKKEKKKISNERRDTEILKLMSTGALIRGNTVIYVLYNILLHYTGTCIQLRDLFFFTRANLQTWQNKRLVKLRHLQYPKTLKNAYA